MPYADGTRRIKDDEWDKHKSHIIQLYLERNHKLEDVVNIMTKDHGFTASPSQYENIFRKWKIFKNKSKKRARLERIQLGKPRMLHREGLVSRDYDDTPRVNGSYMYEFRPESAIAMPVDPVVDTITLNQGVIDWFGSDLVPIEHNGLMSHQGTMDWFDPNNLTPKSGDFSLDTILSSVNDSLLSRHNWLRPSPSTEIVTKLIGGTYGKSRATPAPSSLTRTSNDILCKFLNVVTNSVRTRKHQTPLSVLSLLYSPEDFAGEDWSQLSELPDHVALEARFDGRLITSTINGFAGLRNLPSAAALEFSRRHPTSQLTMINFWNSQSSPLIKAFVENAFKAYLEVDNVDIVQNLLDTGLVDANKAVYYRFGKIRRYTPLDYAAIHQSFKSLRHLLDRKVDIGRSLNNDPLGPLIEHAGDRRLVLDDNFLSSVEALLEAGAPVSTPCINMAFQFADLRLPICLVEHLAFQSPQRLMDHAGDIVKNLTQRDAMRIIDLIIGKGRGLDGAELFHQRYADRIESALDEAINRGYDKLVGILFQYTSSPRKKLQIAIKAQNWKIVKLIREKYLGLSEDLDLNMDEEIEMFIFALMSRDQDRLRSMEKNGVFDRLQGRKLGQAFFEALEAGDLEYSTKILNLDPDFKFYKNGQEGEVAAALDAALCHNFDDIAWKLLKFITIRDFCFYSISREAWYSRSILSIAVERKRLDFVKALIESGFYGMTYELHNKERSILGLAIECGDDSIFDYLWNLRPRDFGPLDDLFKVVLEKKPEIFLDLVKFTRPFLRSKALKAAVTCEKESVIDALISLGAKADNDDVLVEAIKHHPSMVEPLLSQYWKAYPQGRQRYGYDAVEIALLKYSESPELVDKLFAWNLVNANLCCTPSSESDLIDAAIATGNYNIVKKILYVFSRIGTTTFFKAVETNNVEIVQLLIDHGANVNQLGFKHITPLQTAANINNTPIVRLLLQNNADVNARPGEATALQFAAINGNIEMATVLIEHGALLSTPPPPYGNRGRWPLEGAAENGRFDMIEFLWNAPGSFITDEQIQCAVRLAEERGHFGCKEKIEELAARFPRNDVLLATH